MPRAPALLALALLSSCVIVQGAARPPGAAVRAPPPPADAALLQRWPLAVDEVVLVNDEVLQAHVPALLDALRRAAASEGFRVAARSPAPADLVLRTTIDWTPPGADLTPMLFITVALEREGERVDEAMVRRAEAFPGDEAALQQLALELVRPLARSPRTRDHLLSRDP